MHAGGPGEGGERRGETQAARLDLGLVHADKNEPSETEKCMGCSLSEILSISGILVGQ